MPETFPEHPQEVPQLQDTPRELRFKNSGWDWAVRIVIFVAFAFTGTEKFKTDAHAPWVVLFDEIGFGQWFRYLAGVLEIGGGFLTLLSGSVEIGLILLMATMLGALCIVLFWLRRPSEAFFPFAILCGIIAFLLHRRRV
jgi:putative oxidoreductase